MNRRFVATMNLQRPSSPPGVDVCPHCQRETTVYLTSEAGKIVETHRCRDHGDVVPRRRPLINDAPPLGNVWDGEGP